MTLTSKPLAFVLIFILSGGIVISSVLGWWQTESSKIPAAYMEGEFAGRANPADIRGSYTFGDIANSFQVAPETLAQAFQVTNVPAATFPVKDLEALYLESEYEIGTNSVRLFVAYQLGLPFNTTGQEIYLPPPATDILLNEATLSPEQIRYLTEHTVDVHPVSNAEEEAIPVEAAESAPETGSGQAASETTSTEETRVVKGKTVFGDLIGWGVPPQTIEQIIGAPMPDPALKIKDYANTQGLDFETIKEKLQVEVDKAQS